MSNQYTQAGNKEKGLADDPAELKACFAPPSSLAPSNDNKGA
jgi:hypothetical protein